MPRSHIPPSRDHGELSVVDPPSRLRSGDKGYDSRGRPLPGREVNLRKKDSVAARKPGDMVRSDDKALIARAEAVMRGEQPTSSK